MNKSTTLNDHIMEHCITSMEMAQANERRPLWERSCPEMSDIDFTYFGLLRAISVVDSGRDFLQKADENHDEVIPHSTYFNSLKSSRRASMLEAIEEQSYRLLSEKLAAQGIDYLSQFPELDEYFVEAADGHFVEHACHTEKNDKGKVFAAGFIYSMNLRNGLLKPLCCVTNGSKRNHEIPILRCQIEKQNGVKTQDRKRLYIYDKAVTDYLWWDQQKHYDNYMVSVMKENSAATFVESIEFDEKDEINTGVESYSIYETKGVKFSVVHYRDPETQKLFSFITTLPTSINPGTIAILYYKRWTIEKAFNNSKSNLKETKAWSPNSHALNNQMRLTAMVYNIIRTFEEISKKQNPELIHPAEKKYTKDLESRQLKAKKTGGFVNPLLFKARIARISSSTFRSFQSAIIKGRSLLHLMQKLVGRFVSRSIQI